MLYRIALTIGTDDGNTSGSTDPRGHSSDIGSSGSEKGAEPKAYSFSGKVVIGIGLVLAAAAGSTIAAMSVSTSPSIHLSQTGGPTLGGSLTTASLAQKKGEAKQHIDKRFVLIQNDFGWNGTTGGPTIEVNKGEVVQITVINAGLMAHNFGIGQASEQAMSIMKQTDNMLLPDRMKYIPYNIMAAMPCPGCHPLFKEGHIEQFMQPDTQQVTTFTANQAGNFKYFCMVRGHIWLGMVGDLIVKDVNTNSNINNNYYYQAASSTVDANGGQKVSAKEG
jgi:FtsP/CotA-like multicopper oxidase with cupredoxin domain